MGVTRRRAAIVEAATRLFAEKGFAKTTTSEIAREAAVAEGTLYHHFASKDDIFLTIFNETVDGYLAGMEEAASGAGTGEDLLRAAVRFHFEYLRRHQAPFLVILRDFPPHLDGKEPKVPPARKKKFEQLTASLAAVAERGARDGTLRLSFSPRDAAQVIRSVLYGTTRHKMLGIIDMPFSRLAAIVENFCLGALGAAKEKETAPRRERR